ncbi:AI-2E family transporter [Bacteroidales bacterium OttesenSCG-928-M11]|nr:AI-2E family transporter [Bacteroidales bacterium OttesenSCG-928-M11]
MYAGKQFNERIKQVVFIILLVFLFVVMLKNLSYFVSSFLGAFTLYMILRKPHNYFAKKWKTTTGSTAFLLFVTFLGLLLVGTGVFYLFYGKLKHFHPQGIMNGIHHIQDIILERFGYNIFSEDLVNSALNLAGNIIPGIISTTGNVFANLLMMMFILFFMLQKNKEFVKALESFIPLSGNSVQLLKNETNNMVIGNAIGIPFIMFSQGIVSALGYWITGAGDPLVWGVITGIFGLLPIVGTGGVWVPLAINLLIGGNIWQGIFLFAYGALVISSVDNIVRMGLMKKMANVHPLITLFGIIFGMNLFGFWGIVFGPLMLSSFLLLFKIYKKEFLSENV